MIEEAAVDELVGVNGFVAVGLGEELAMFCGKGELMFAEAGEFTLVVVSGIGSGEGKSARAVNGEVEFDSEFEMNDGSGAEVAEEVIELSDSGVDVAAKLEIFFEESERRGFLKENGEKVFVEVS